MRNLVVFYSLEGKYKVNCRINSKKAINADILELKKKV